MFPATDPAVLQSPSQGRCLRVSPSASLSHSDLKHPGLSWCGAGCPALGGEGASKLWSLLRLSSKAPAAVEVPGTFPAASAFRLFLNVLCSIWLPSFIEAGIPSAVLQKTGWGPSWVHQRVGPAPTYSPPPFTRDLILWYFSNGRLT